MQELILLYSYVRYLNGKGKIEMWIKSKWNMVVSSRVLQGYRGLDINNKATMK